MNSIQKFSNLDLQGNFLNRIFRGEMVPDDQNGIFAIVSKAMNWLCEVIIIFSIFDYFHSSWKIDWIHAWRPESVEGNASLPQDQIMFVLYEI